MPTTFGFTDVNDMSFSAFNCIQTTGKNFTKFTNNDCLGKYKDGNPTDRTAKVSISDISNAYGVIRNQSGASEEDKLCALYDLSMAYDQIYAKINDTASTQVTGQREKLDSELSEILTSKNIYSESQNRVESAVLSGILWTTLAVTLVYFVFRKL